MRKALFFAFTDFPPVTMTGQRSAEVQTTQALLFCVCGGGEGRGEGEGLEKGRGDWKMKTIFKAL